MAGAGMVLGSLSSCASVPVYKAVISNHQILVPVALFAKADMQIIQPKNLYYNIALKKESNNTYTALLMRCTHADNQLTNTGNGFKCNLHGSSFDHEGQVIMGPAEKPLHRYTTEVIDEQIIIHIS